MGISKLITKKWALASGLAVVCGLANTPARAQDAAVNPVPVGPAAGAPQAEGSRVYIAVGSPNVKKVLLAVEATAGSGPAAEFNQTLTNDMDFTDLFELLPVGRLPAKSGDLTAYKVLGVEFVLRSSLLNENGNVVAEIRLFDVNRGTQVLGRRYPLVSKSGQPGRELAHYAGNDIVQSLTGTAGVFRTRLLMSCGDKRKEIYIMDFDGQNVKQLTRDGNFVLSPSWHPDGKRILFTSYKPATAGGFINPNLYMVDLSTNKRSLVSGARGLNTGGSFNPRENKLAYTFSQNGHPEIYILNLDTKTRSPLTKTQFFSVEPNYSPDGSRIAFSSSETSQPHIFVSNADGTGKKRLTFAGRYNSSPNWSPLGDKIAFSGQENTKNNFNVFLIDPSGSNLVRLTDGANSSENPVFSPDARHIAFSGNQTGKYRIYVMTAKGERIRTISPPGLGNCKQPAWSPRL